MPVEGIRRYGAGCLRRRSEPATVGSQETRQLIDTLWETLVDDGGVGLAAPQIGVNQRVVVIRDPQQAASRQRLNLVNPVVTETFGPLEDYEEGCLSFPGLYRTVKRPRGAIVKYHDADGQPQQLRSDKLVARIALHELDHLDGVLFVDRLPRWQRWLLRPRLLLIMFSGLFVRDREQR